MSRHGKVRVKIDKTLIQRQVQSGSKRGTFAMLDHIASVSKDQVPLDMGPLKNSCVVDVAEDGLSGTISYDTPYAVVQHENRHFRHQRGRKAKYLEDPLNDKGVQLEALAVLAGAMGEDLGG